MTTTNHAILHLFMIKPPSQKTQTSLRVKTQSASTLITTGLRERLHPSFGRRRMASPPIQEPPPAILSTPPPDCLFVCLFLLFSVIDHHRCVPRDSRVLGLGCFSSVLWWCLSSFARSVERVLTRPFGVFAFILLMLGC